MGLKQRIPVPGLPPDRWPEVDWPPKNPIPGDPRKVTPQLPKLPDVVLWLVGAWAANTILRAADDDE